MFQGLTLTQRNIIDSETQIFNLKFGVFTVEFHKQMDFGIQLFYADILITLWKVTFEGYNISLKYLT
jgi:hypothetical protein